MRRILSNDDKRKMASMYFGEDEKAVQHTQAEIAKEFNVAQSTVHKAIKCAAYMYCGRAHNMSKRGISEAEIMQQLGISNHLMTSLWAYAMKR